MKLRISKWVRFTSLCFVFLMLIGLNSLQAKAGGDTFTITFRAGNLGNIDSATYYKVEAMAG
ncbi:MAG: hypothetical protein HGA25_06875, partial [Clostridiales bacterium]|nr:hypothetical protein [Clostridiales bacterium]